MSSESVNSLENGGHTGFSKRVFGSVFLSGSQIYFKLVVALLSRTAVICPILCPDSRKLSLAEQLFVCSIVFTTP